MIEIRVDLRPHWWQIWKPMETFTAICHEGCGLRAAGYLSAADAMDGLKIVHGNWQSARRQTVRQIAAMYEVKLEPWQVVMLAEIAADDRMTDAARRAAIRIRMARQGRDVKP